MARRLSTTRTWMGPKVRGVPAKPAKVSLIDRSDDGYVRAKSSRVITENILENLHYLCLIFQVTRAAEYS